MTTNNNSTQQPTVTHSLKYYDITFQLGENALSWLKQYFDPPNLQYLISFIKNFGQKTEIISISVEKIDKIHKLYLHLKTEDIELFAKHISELPGINGEIKHEEIQITNLHQKEMNTEIAPKEIVPTIEKGKRLMKITHRSLNGIITSILEPVLSNEFLVVCVQTEIYSSNDCPKIITHNLSLLIKESDILPGNYVNNDETKVVGVQHIENDITKQTTKKKLTGEIGLDSTGPSAKLGGEIETTNETETKNIEFNETKEDGLHGKAVRYRLHKELRKNKTVVIMNHYFYFHLKKEYDPEKLYLESTFSFPAILNVGNLTKTKRSALLYHLRKSDIPQNRIVIGGVMGFPRCGKTSFINIILQKHVKNESLPTDPTTYIRKHDFIGFKIGDDFRSFSFMDTNGYYFNPDDKIDEYMLERFLMGLPELTDINKESNFEKVPIDGENAITHVVLTLSARDIYQGVTYWQSFLYTGSVKKEEMTAYSKLYYLIVKKLAKVKHNDQIDLAKRKVVILVTHCDMIPYDNLHKVRDQIRDYFMLLKVPENYIFFGQKECMWDQNALIEHDKKVKEIKNNLKPGEDLLTVLDSKGIPLHKGSNYCIKPNCKHDFTNYDDYEKIIRRLFSQQ